MVIDTSAIVAIINDENDRPKLELALVEADHVLMSSATALECTLVVESRFGEAANSLMDALIDKASIEVVAFDSAQLAIARAAFRRFGRGRHAAHLNFGDCFSYALAKHMNEPLLFKGNDFAQTDVASVL